MQLQTNPTQPNHHNHISTINSNNYFSLDPKITQPSTTLLKQHDTQSNLPQSKPFSTKLKLSQQNTKLHINIQNLSTIIFTHQQNKKIYQIQIDKYKDKLIKYKNKIKQKDIIITKLLDKFEKYLQINSQYHSNQLLKSHQQYLKNINLKINNSQLINIQNYLHQYQQLFNAFQQQQKYKLTLQKDKQLLSNTILQLKNGITNPNIDTSQQLKQNQQLSKLKLKLIQTQTLLQKYQQSKQNHLVKSSNIIDLSIHPSNLIKNKLQQYQQQNQKYQKKIIQLQHQLSQIQSKLSQKHSILQQKQHMLLNIQQQLSAINQSFLKYKSQLLKLQNTIKQIQNKCNTSIKQIQNQLNAKINQQSSFQQQQNQIQLISNNLTQYLLNFNQHHKLFDTLQNNYLQKLKQYELTNTKLTDQLQSQQQKRNIFQLKLITYNAEQGTENPYENQPKNFYQQFQNLLKQSIQTKQQNLTLHQNIITIKQSHKTLQNSLIKAHQQIQHLKSQLNHQPNSNQNQNSQPQQQKQLILKQVISQHLSNSAFLQNIIKNIQTTTLQQLKQQYIKQKLQNNSLQNQIDQLLSQNNKLQLQLQQLNKIQHNLQQPLFKSTNSNQIKSLTKSGKILKRGQSYLQSSNMQGGYQVNIINVNDIPPDIQQMNYQQLASKYEAVRDELCEIKQKSKPKSIQHFTKITQSIISPKPLQSQSLSHQPHIDDDQNYQQLANSQQIQQNFYNNITEQLDRLTKKNKQLQKYIQQLKKQHLIKITSYQNLIKQYNQKFKSSQQTNQNLSNLVIHLQQQLTRYQNNLDISGISQKGSQIIQTSPQKSHPHQQKPQPSTTNPPLKKKQYQPKKHNTQQQPPDQKYQQSQQLLINFSQQQHPLPEKPPKQIKQQHQFPINPQDNTSYQCPNCQSLIKVNANLAKSVSKYQQQASKKQSSLKKQLQSINNQFPSLTQPTPQNFTTLLTQNNKLKQLLSQLQVNQSINTSTQKHLQTIQQSNQQLKQTLHQKQKLLLKLKTYHQLHSPNSNKNNFQQIINSYEQKIQQLQNLIQKSSKHQQNTSDLYHTIKYLTNQCQTLKQQLSKQIPLLHPLQKSTSQKQLQQKYQDTIDHLQQLQKISQQNNYKNIDEMVNACCELLEKHSILIKQNTKLKNKIDELQTNNSFEKNNQLKQQQPINLSQMFSKTSVIPEKLAQKQPSQPKILKTLSIHLQKLKTSIQATSSKIRPTFQLPSFQQLPPLQQLLKLLLTRLHLIWSAFQQRTSQYNQLRDQMNIISLQCLKNSNMSLHPQKPQQFQDKNKIQQLSQNHYEQIFLQLIEYENQNKKLEKQVNRLKQQLSNYKRQVEDAQNRYITSIKSQSNQQIPFNQPLLTKLLESASNTPTKPQPPKPLQPTQLPQLIALFLQKISSLQKNLQQIQTQFTQKNLKLQSLLDKQKSFINKNGLDQSKKLNQSNKQSYDQYSKYNNPNLYISGSITTPVPMISQKSNSINSVKLFKQIQQLTKINQQLLSKKHKFKNLLELFTKSIDLFLKNPENTIPESTQKQLQAHLNLISKQLQQDSKKDNSVFDIQGDIILSSSFVHKPRHPLKIHTQGEALQQINHFQPDKVLQLNSKIKKKQQDKLTLNTQKLHLINQNLPLLQQLLSKYNSQNKTQYPLDYLKKKLTQKLSLQQIQQLFHPSNINNLSTKITNLLSQPQKKVAFQPSQKDLIKIKTQQSHQFSQLQQQPSSQYIQTSQIQSIINRIYPKKSQLCIIVAKFVQMFMLAVTQKQILKAIQYLFSNLKRKQNQFKDQIRKRDQTVAIYGQKLQNLLNKKYSQQQSCQKSQLLNQNQFQKTQGFKSQYQLKKQQQNDNSLNQSNSISYSGILQKSIK